MDYLLQEKAGVRLHFVIQILQLELVLPGMFGWKAEFRDFPVKAGAGHRLT
jgi:hypothetical protein